VKRGGSPPPRGGGSGGGGGSDWPTDVGPSRSMTTTRSARQEGQKRKDPPKAIACSGCRRARKRCDGDEHPGAGWRAGGRGACFAVGLKLGAEHGALAPGLVLRTRRVFQCFRRRTGGWGSCGGGSCPHGLIFLPGRAWRERLESGSVERKAGGRGAGVGAAGALGLSCRRRAGKLASGRPRLREGQLWPQEQLSTVPARRGPPMSGPAERAGHGRGD